MALQEHFERTKLLLQLLYLTPQVNATEGDTPSHAHGAAQRCPYSAVRTASQQVRSSASTAQSAIPAIITDKSTLVDQIPGYILNRAEKAIARYCTAPIHCT